MKIFAVERNFVFFGHEAISAFLENDEVLQASQAQCAMTVWPSGLRRWLQAPVRKGVGSNPTAVTLFSSQFLEMELRTQRKSYDSEGIRTPAGRAQWISSPSP